MTEQELKRTTLISVDGTSITQVGDFALPPPPDPPPPDPPPDPPPPDSQPTYADRQATIPAGTNTWQAVINANSAGTLFGVARGNHFFTTKPTPRTGDRFVGETDAAGVPLSLIKGNWNQTQTGTGIDGLFSTYPASIKLLRLDISLFAPAFQQCAINGGNSWTIYKCNIHDNKSGGIRIGASATMFGSKVYHNGQIGMKSGGNGSLVDSCEFFTNNYATWHDWTNEAGAMKYIGGFPANCTIRNSFFHHNTGPGIWYDEAGNGGVIEDNLCEDNLGPGIFYEISLQGTIRRNTSRRNGGGANIYLANAAGVSGNPLIVEDNITADHNQHAEIWMKDDPGRSPRTGWTTIRRNDMRRPVRSGTVNVAIGEFGSTTVPTGIVIDNNTYRTNISDAWQWVGTKRTWTQWRALGFDNNGTLLPY